jgi:RDD family
MPVRWVDGRVAVEDSVEMPRAVTGKTLRDAFWADVSTLTLGLLRARDNSLFFGPLELLRFGPDNVTRSGVEWSIEGGLLARAPGGRLSFESANGRLVASLEDYRPVLPRAVYALTQVPVHHLWTRLHLLRVRGRLPSPGVPVDPSRRLAAAAIDFGFCVALAAVVARRRRVVTVLGIASGYHIACWTLSGRTLGGALMKQRVVAVDGSRLSAGQAVVRLLMVPIAAMSGRNLHDEVAGTEVIDRIQ